MAADPPAAPRRAVAARKSARKSGGKSDGELAKRVVAGLAMASVALASDYWGGLMFAALVALVAVLIIHEWFGMTGLRHRWRASLWLGWAALLGVLGLAVVGLWPLVALVILVGGVACLALLVQARRSRQPAGDAVWFVGGVLYAALPSISLICLRGQADGFAVILWLMGSVWATDSFAYFCGRAIGGPKLAPRWSPNKTWAGLFGGMAGSAVLGLVLALALDWPVVQIALLSALIAVVSQIGDLGESALKRFCGVKDSGRIIPGHGGVMDRVDGLVTAAPVVALLWAPVFSASWGAA